MTHLVEIATPEGGHFVLDPNDPLAANVPSGLRFTSQRGDGWGQGSFTVARDTLRDWIDLGLTYDTLVRSERGQASYRGRIAQAGRDTQDGDHFTITLVGYMSHARARPLQAVFVDRDLSGWEPPPLERRVQQVGAGNPLQSSDFTMANDSGGLTFQMVTKKLVVNTSGAEAWYSMPEGQSAGKVQYVAHDSANAGMDPPELHATDNRDGTGGDTYSLTIDGDRHTATIDPPRRYLFVRVSPNGDQNKDSPYHLRFESLAVYGDQGLPLHDLDDPKDPQGVLVSDVIAWLCATYCPLLDPSGIASTNTPIAQAAFREATDAFTAWTTLNDWHRWELGVDSERVLHYYPADLTTYDWQVRLSDPGTDAELQGDSIDALYNGMAVAYTDVHLGPRLLLPSEYPDDLLSQDPDNPWNRQGEINWGVLSLSASTIERDALLAGTVALQEANMPKSAGRLTILEGVIRDHAGNEHDPAEVLAGQTVAITDHPNDRPRLISATDWDEDGGSLTLSLEQPDSRIDAFVGRLEAALDTAGLT